jgi:iron(III) transport system substrate-binding protein
VVLYCSVDEAFAKPIVNELQKRTGLRIDALYDVEAAKTAGLANRIRAEKARPQGDVFWSSALLQALLLQREGLLQPYASPAASDIPARLKASDGAWTGMGLRLHTLGFKKGLQNPPRKLEDLLQPRFKGKIGISNPQFGTGSDWAASIGAERGAGPALAFFKALKANGLRVLPGNSVVAERVASGELLAGIADSDDWEIQKKQTGNIDIGLGFPGLTVPGAVAILKGAPHQAEARQLTDNLLALQTEALLTQKMAGVYSTRPNGKAGTAKPLPPNSKSSLQDASRWPAAWDALSEPLAEVLLGEE